MLQAHSSHFSGGLKINIAHHRASRILRRLRKLFPDFVAVSDNKLHSLSAASAHMFEDCSKRFLIRRTSDTMPCGSCSGSMANA